MIPNECKRLAEVDFPIGAVGKYCLAEKARRFGTPHQLHLWCALASPCGVPVDASRAAAAGSL